MLPRHSRARASKVSRLKAMQPPKPRPHLNEEQTRQLASIMREKFGFEPKDFQLAAVKAQIEGVDMIVQASTGAGKTAIAAGPHFWPGNEKKFTIMTCPLLSLEEEMVQTFQNDYGLTAITLNSKNGGCDPEKIKDILALKYQIILISPEMLQSRTFHTRVLRHSAFMRHIISMFIDEAHCIVHWGAEFRKQYGTLGKLRAFFPRGTPVMAVSATLTPRVVRAVQRSLYFAQSDAQWRFVNKGNDRPNVSLVVRACEHSLNSYTDLNFLIPSNLRDPAEIPKTYLYVNHIPTGGEIIDHLNAQICALLDNVNTVVPPLSRKARKRLRGIIRPFNATLSTAYRTRAMDLFRSGKVRILVCTDAAGMGCNIPDVDRVVQWKLPATFSHWIQRAGRAARGPGRTGIAILLVERSAYNVDLLNTSKPASTTKPSKLKKTAPSTNTDTTPETTVKRDPKHVREYALAHGVARGGSGKTDQVPTGQQPPVHEEDADEGLHAFAQSTVCRRKAWAAAFESNISIPIVPCCDICDPALLDQTRPPAVPPDKRTNLKALKRGEPDVVARRKLHTWRETTHSSKHPHAQYDETGILPDELVETLVSHGPLTSVQVATMLQDKWVFWGNHGDDLSTLVQSLDITFKALPPKPRRAAQKSSNTVAVQPQSVRVEPPALGLPRPELPPHAIPPSPASNQQALRFHGMLASNAAPYQGTHSVPPYPQQSSHRHPNAPGIYTPPSQPPRAAPHQPTSTPSYTFQHRPEPPHSFVQRPPDYYAPATAGTIFASAHSSHTDRTLDTNHPHYIPTYSAYPSQSQAVPYPSRPPSTAVMPAPPPTARPPPHHPSNPSQHRLPGHSGSDYYSSSSQPSQYSISQTQYYTTYNMNSNLGQAIAQTRSGAPPPTSTQAASSSYSSYNNTYYPEQCDYMQY